MQETSQKSNDWFASWFDSPYYPMLYRHRNEIEAQEFLSNLMNFLQLRVGASVLDLACGQGRHARTLHALGYNVVGLDLSPASIAVARELAAAGQEFDVADMRDFNLSQSFDAIVNLFTSFGYLSDETDNTRVLARVYDHLKPEGIFILDYLNAYPLLNRSEEEQCTVVDGVEFRTRKYSDAKCVMKDIAISDGAKIKHFQERVQLFTCEDLTRLLSQTGFTVEHVFGSYALDAFEPSISPRCLIIARR